MTSQKFANVFIFIKDNKPYFIPKEAKYLGEKMWFGFFKKFFSEKLDIETAVIQCCITPSVKLTLEEFDQVRPFFQNLAQQLAENYTKNGFFNYETPVFDYEEGFFKKTVYQCPKITDITFGQFIGLEMNVQAFFNQNVADKETYLDTFVSILYVQNYPILISHAQEALHRKFAQMAFFEKMMLVNYYLYERTKLFSNVKTEKGKPDFAQSWIKLRTFICDRLKKTPDEVESINFANILQMLKDFEEK